jgi:sterol desaturase/sphingolipid hydroxylase (fatty acid hydroxylase superfamily)
MPELIFMAAMTMLGHVLTSLTQAALHRWLGHTRAGGSLHRIHAGSHHTIYTGTRMLSRRYDEDEVSITPFFLAPAVAVVAFFLWLLPLRSVIALAVGIGISYAAHVYLHAHYHLSTSWLRRYAWFRRLRRLHAIHHRDGTKNFGLISFFWDRTFGTFCDSHPPR